jgi:hypothetical protein
LVGRLLLVDEALLLEGLDDGVTRLFGLQSLERLDYGPGGLRVEAWPSLCADRQISPQAAIPIDDDAQRQLVGAPPLDIRDIAAVTDPPTDDVPPPAPTEPSELESF